MTLAKIREKVFALKQVVAPGSPTYGGWYVPLEPVLALLQPRKPKPTTMYQEARNAVLGRRFTSAEARSLIDALAPLVEDERG